MKGFKLLVAAILSLSLLFILSCKKPGPSTFTLNLKTKYGTQDFALNSANTDAQGRYVIFSTFKFYLSHINLIKTDGSLVNVADLAIFDLSDAATLSVSIKNVEGDFKGISFGCGLDSVQNRSDANNDSLYPFPNPYNGLWDMYWDMNTQYRFEVVEGKWDTAVMPIMRNVIFYHIGTNPAYRQGQINKSFSVCCGNPYTLNLTLDVQQIFNNTATGKVIDIATEPSTSSEASDNPVIMPTFADNFSNSFSY